MPSIGEVDITLYWGTLYDTINVPLHSEQIIQDATKSMTFTAYFVWQTTYLASVRLNIEDYQVLVGAQYARIVDKGTTNLGAHWYDVLDYQQISQGCVELALRYDTLLTIPISTMRGVSGIIRRWTPAQDTVYKYLSTPEPIDLADPLSITWVNIPVIATTDRPIPIAGFPYDMTQAPELLTYTNPNGQTTNTYYPKLTKPAITTTFLSGLSPAGSINALNYNDGMTYYKWLINSKAYNTFNLAVSLAIDIPVNAFLLPDEEWFNIDENDNGINILSGKAQNFPVSLALYDSTVENQKAGCINTTFTLQNAFSGDAVTVNNYQLLNTDVRIFSLPYSNGCFLARFLTYMGADDEPSGLVSSPTWQPLTVSSGIGFGVQSNAISNTMTADTQRLAAKQENLRAAYDVAATWHAGQQNSANIMGESFIELLGAAFSAANMNNSNLQGMITAPLNAGLAQVQNQQSVYRQINRTQFLAQQADAAAAHQAELLQYQGNVGRLSPPMVKYAGIKDTNRYTYAFQVMKAAPSTRDKQRMDMFFRMFGYNVDSELLTTESQLMCRSRFTFIQVDDFRITHTSLAPTGERILDFQTIKDIQQRFAQGLRIWRTTPNFDYTISNPISVSSAGE